MKNLHKIPGTVQHNALITLRVNYLPDDYSQEDLTPEQKDKALAKAIEKGCLRFAQYATILLGRDLTLEEIDKIMQQAILNHDFSSAVAASRLLGITLSSEVLEEQLRYSIDNFIWNHFVYISETMERDITTSEWEEMLAKLVIEGKYLSIATDVANLIRRELTETEKSAFKKSERKPVKGCDGHNERPVTLDDLCAIEPVE